MNSIQSLRRELENLPQDPPVIVMERTADRLEGMNFSPILLHEIPGFLRLSKGQILLEFDRIAQQESTASGNGTLQGLNLIVYWFRLLTQLRKDKPEAWDEINELYEDD